MRSVAYITTSYPPAVGGVQLHAHQLIRRLAPHQKQWVVSQWDTNRTDWLLGSTLLSPRSPRPYEIDGIEVRRLAFGLADRLGMLPATPCFYPAPWAFSPWLAYIFRRRLAPLMEGADLVHAFRIGRENLVVAALKEARKRDIPFVFTPTHHPRWVGYRYSVYLDIYRKADMLIALTEAERRALVKLGVPEGRVRVIGHGPTLADSADPIGFRRKYGLDGDPVVLFVGQKYRYKGLDILLEAARTVWRRCPETRFLFIGPRTNYSRRLFGRSRDVRALELDTVSCEEKTSALAACTLLALPSRQESFGGVFTEAWSFDKPVIGGRIPAVECVVSDGEDGFLVDHDPAELADRILILLQDSALGERMGMAGHSKVNRLYTWEVLARKTHEIYQEALGRSSVTGDIGPEADLRVPEGRG